MRTQITSWLSSAPCALTSVASEDGWWLVGVFLKFEFNIEMQMKKPIVIDGWGEWMVVGLGVLLTVYQYYMRVALIISVQ
jgi:hypothetical protein